MTSYYNTPGPYLTDIRNGGNDPQQHYNPPSIQNGDSCDQRQYLQPQYATSPVQGQTYPRFPPYDRLEIRPITAHSDDSQSPPSHYYSQCSQSQGNMPQPAHQTPQHTPLTHPNAYVPQDGVQQNCRGSPSETQNMVPQQFPSCKMQQQQNPQAMVQDPNGVHRPVNPDCAANNMHPQHCQSPVHSPQQMYPPNHVPQQPPTPQNVNQVQQGNAGSTLYPWMRSQFGPGFESGEGMHVCKCIVLLRHGGTLNSRRTTSALVRLVEGEEGWDDSDNPQGLLPENWRWWNLTK
ncbi:uncharacterized protein TNCV_2859602 [Trichonephila clavipes]|nr:uncharacterized protein TNCV_2859602 [Trichonephila clavipes]